MSLVLGVIDPAINSELHYNGLGINTNLHQPTDLPESVRAFKTGGPAYISRFVFPFMHSIETSKTRGASLAQFVEHLGSGHDLKVLFEPPPCSCSQIILKKKKSLEN